MGPRHRLQTVLETLMGELPEQKLKVYFKPKPKLKLTYPCIIYARDDTRSIFANNAPYSHTNRYQVTVITDDPDSPIPDKVAALKMTTFLRQFQTDELYHDIYSLYF